MREPLLQKSCECQGAWSRNHEMVYMYEHAECLTLLGMQIDVYQSELSINSWETDFKTNFSRIFESFGSSDIGLKFSILNTFDFGIGTTFAFFHMVGNSVLVTEASKRWATGSQRMWAHLRMIWAGIYSWRLIFQFRHHVIHAFGWDIRGLGFCIYGRNWVDNVRFELWVKYVLKDEANDSAAWAGLAWSLVITSKWTHDRERKSQISRAIVQILEHPFWLLRTQSRFALMIPNLTFSS